MNKRTSLLPTKKQLTTHALLVTGNHLDQFAALQTLSELKLTVTCAKSIEEALSYIPHLSKRNLILTDLDLSYLAGIDFVKAIRARHQKEPILCIGFSGNSDYCYPAMNAGYNAFLLKPLLKFSLERILETFEFRQTLTN